MLKMKKINFLKNMTIAKRVTLLYGNMFSITIIIISAILWNNASNISQSIVQNELKEAVSDIKEYISETEDITEDGMTSAIKNKSVYAKVTDVTDFIENDRMPMVPKDFEKNINDRKSYISNFSDNEDINKIHIPSEPEKMKNDFRISYINNIEYMFINEDFNIDGKFYVIDVFKQNIDDGQYMAVLTIKLIFMDFAGIIIAFLLARYISKIMLKPVENIRNTAERISVEDLSQRIDIDGPDDELKELSITFNSMIDRLESSFKSQTQFVSDASHELRTPISVIQGYASLINRWGKSDPVILQESIDSIISETEHMSELVKKLLFLARSDRKNISINKENVCLNDIVSDMVKDVQVMEIGREIVFENIDEVYIYADSDLIKQLLWIYTENAIKYTNENGIITFRVYKKDKKAYFEVEDNGIGISNDDIKNIFDRFYRADKSRNKDIPGTGLGLSIAKWIIDNNNGEIEVKSKIGEGTIFINSFPISKMKEG